MFEATLESGELLRKVIAAVSDLVSDGNFDCNTHGIALQGMDSSHVSLVSMMLNADGFKPYRCDREITLGINLASLSKVLKCMGSKDKVSIKAEDQADSVQFVFESPEEDRIMNFDLKLMDIDAEQLGIPDTQYKCVIKMGASEFQRICRDLATIGDTVVIAAHKEGVKFSVAGDIGSGDMTLKNRMSDAVDEDEDDAVLVECDEPVTQTFALRYLNFFTKATSLAKSVSLSLSPEVPLVVEYKMEDLGHVRYFLAPKIEDEE